MLIETESQLRDIYGHPNGRARDKVMPSLDHHSKHFISNSPFLVLSTMSAEGKMDASPRGGLKGFVHFQDDNTLIIPDSKGNNRVDSMSNIVETGRVGLLFLIPGVDETLRVNGTAQITTDPDILAKFPAENRPPLTCLMVQIEEVFLHCAKAFMRSKLWDADAQIDPKSFPSIGEMLKDQLGSKEDAETREAMRERYKGDL
jgi:PPOX class probable FMN-dependent enzyme